MVTNLDFKNTYISRLKSYEHKNFLGVRAKMCLENYFNFDESLDNDIKIIEKIIEEQISLQSLLKIKNFGRKSLNEIICMVDLVVYKPRNDKYSEEQIIKFCNESWERNRWAK